MKGSARFEPNAAFFNYPKQAAFGRILPKSKIYEHSGANARLKDLFVNQVEQIVWQYKLAPETINLSVSRDIVEIQVFSIYLKTPELHYDVLRCIDGAVQFPIIFELNFDGRTQVIAAYKQQNVSDVSHCVLSDYFSTAWLPSDSERSDMPLVLDLGNLYEQILYRLIPLSLRPNEVLFDLILRLEQVQSKQREVESAIRRLAKEKQFNRKIEVNTELRKLKSELEELRQ